VQKRLFAPVADCKKTGVEKIFFAHNFLVEPEKNPLFRQTVLKRSRDKVFGSSNHKNPYGWAYTKGWGGYHPPPLKLRRAQPSFAEAFGGASSSFDEAWQVRE